MEGDDKMEKEEKSYLETLKENANELKNKAENEEHKNHLESIKEKVDELK